MGYRQWRKRLESGQGLASADATMNVAGCDPDMRRAMASDESEQEILEQAGLSRHRVQLAVQRVHSALKFFQEMEAVMSGAAGEVIQALGVFAEHFKSDQSAVDAVITLIKSKPTDAEMTQIKQAIADMQAGVDAQTAAANAAVADASGSGSVPADTGAGTPVAPPADTGTSTADTSEF